ncbi:STAS domain-containing protein [Streptomyces subrutilus]|uniref:Anti-sigma factor antagonist n=1 Tax=Streptomyces subrutilus TaxID=36818 RepID=A0A5P2UW33_9ACTN|nr:STAS domain-containing protein [Streptomyces subrutilus]QEU82549.1 anti-sigma factor antagonist [Streptomyces subrutilus]WSJ27973.1 STAS domain-containing protein [Streptomyces subrutilus]GGZ82005.1 hypothetical protein GCM10010371_47110 [Streptomyces subrutilus]
MNLPADLPPPLILTPVAPDAHTVRIALSGDLDHETCDLLLSLVEGQLTDRPDMVHLHLDCAGLLACDSMGLAALLMVRRRASGAGVRLYLDHRTLPLDRLLMLTGTLEHLTGPPAAVRERSEDQTGR